jgi:GNAT superfamily N-acetyltransferase
MTNRYALVEKKPTAADLLALRKGVGWHLFDQDTIEAGLVNSLYGICAVADGSVVGAARVVGDGCTVFYVQDVIVHPDYQGQGIGAAIMERVMAYIGAHACRCAVVGLMSALGKEGFYERYGFWKRPTEQVGHGMIQYWGFEDEVRTVL